MKNLILSVVLIFAAISISYADETCTTTSSEIDSAEIIREIR